MKKALTVSCVLLLGSAMIPLEVSASAAPEGGIQNPSAYELVARKVVVKIKRGRRHHRDCTVRKRVVRMDGVKRVRTVRVCR